MRMRKKVLSFLTAAVLAIVCIGMTGCGRFGNPDDGGNGRGDQTALKIWIQSTNQPSYFIGWFKAAFEEEYPEIELNFTPSTSLGGELDVSLTGSDAPDISATWAHFLKTLSSGNRIQDIDNLLKPYESEFQEMALLDKVDGVHYGAPISGLSSPVIFFNRTLLESLNLIPENWQGPADYAELKTLCQKIKATQRPGTAQYYKALILSSGFHMMQSIHARTMTGGQLEAIMAPYSDSAANPFDAPGFENGFKAVQKMTADGVFSTPFFDNAAALDAFRTGESLMVSAISLDLLSLSSCSFEIGSFLLPADIPYSSTASDGTAVPGAGVPDSLVSGTYTDVFVVNARTEKLDACKKFFDFLYSPAAQEKLLEFFLFPVIKGTGLNGMSAGKREIFDAALKGVYDVMQADGMTPFYTTYFFKDGLDVIVDNGYKSAVQGGATADIVAQASAKWTA